MQNYLGEIAAILASLCFSIGPIFNTQAGKRINVVTVNRVRLLLTMFLLTIPHWLTEGTLFPFQASVENWFNMGLSGLFGLVIADILLFGAFVTIGTRLSMLISCLNPVFGSLMAWFLLDDKITNLQMLGILVTVIGVAWVVFERNTGNEAKFDWRLQIRGLALAFGAAFFHAASAIASKKGLTDGLPAISGHMIRTFVALLLIMIPMLSPWRAKRTMLELRSEPEVMKYLVAGVIFGPLLGMWFSLFSIQNTHVGVATSLSSLSPIWLLVIGRFFFKEQISPRAVLGSLVVMMGVGIMFL